MIKPVSWLEKYRWSLKICSGIFNGQVLILLSRAWNWRWKKFLAKRLLFFNFPTESTWYWIESLMALGLFRIAGTPYKLFYGIIANVLEFSFNFSTKFYANALIHIFYRMKIASKKSTLIRIAIIIAIGVNRCASWKSNLNVSPKRPFHTIL